MPTTHAEPRQDYVAPDVEVLGQLTDLAAGAGDKGALVVMQTGAIPGE
jgi:hypothetical protein